jgi:NAD(P)-dependent dehydrogenase (short-subunit alcohol dehydrogenase family)
LEEGSITRDNWALVLGASSGFGEAISIGLAKAGMHIFGVHLDRRSTLPNAERVAESIRKLGREAVFFNINAADQERRTEALGKMEEVLRERGNPSGVRVLVHSLAFGTLKPYIAPSEKEMATPAGINMTMDVMAHSLVYWTQELILRKMMAGPARIFAMTSAGGHRVWKTYGPVSAAKAALEAHVRQLAVELAPHGITANSIRAGVTVTPALEKIPGSEEIIKKAKDANPSGRLTTPDDVAAAVVALCSPGTHWITGNVIGVDGGEDLI